MTLSIEPRSDALGAEVRGVDLSKPVDDATLGEIRDAWHEHLLLIYPDQTLTPEQHIAYSRHFGDLQSHPSGRHNHPDYPELLLLTNQTDDHGNSVGLRDGGSVWHSDLSYMAHPSRGSLLYSLAVPEVGGDTEWANMYMAYDALPGDTRRRIAGLNAVHQFDQEANPRLSPPVAAMAGPEDHGSIWSKKSAAVKARTPDVVHPMVRIHRESGRRALFVNRRFTIAVEGMARDAGEALLLELFDCSERPEHVYHHRWRLGELLMWDNRCTIHMACGGFALPEIRHMHRTTILGEVPQAA
jgi:taurine dioxygenase